MENDGGDHMFSDDQKLYNLSKSPNKIVFHRSAGTGRTGTIIAIYNII